MKKHSFFPYAVLLLALLMCGCKNAPDDNKGLEFDQLNVNLKGTLTGTVWTKDAAIGVFSTCTRNGQTGHSMSAAENAKFVALSEGESANLKHASENDGIVAYADDHNFTFYAYYPYIETMSNKLDIPVGVQSTQHFTPGMPGYSFYTTKKNVTSIVAAVDLEFKNLFSTFDLQVANNIFEDVTNPVLKKMLIQPIVDGNFSGEMALSGSYNLETGVFTANETTRDKKIIIDFGENGLTLADAFTSIPVAVMPLTIPEGGFEIIFTDINDEEETVTIMTEDGGKQIVAGEVVAQRISRQEEQVTPVNFPVTFPVGFPNGEAVALKTDEIGILWANSGIYYCPDQSQAYMQFVKVSDESYKTVLEWSYSASAKLASPGVKVMWTGDCFEFILPVKDFEAGTTIKMTFPHYSRKAPAFWNLEYFDGGEWKCNKETLTYATSSVQMDATFCFITDKNNVYTHSMTFANGIENGYIKIRLTCADGSWCGQTATTISQITTAAAPWYFGQQNISTEIKFEIE